jgi:hypothetical protein
MRTGRDGQEPVAGRFVQTRLFPPKPLSDKGAGAYISTRRSEAARCEMYRENRPLSGTRHKLEPRCFTKCVWREPHASANSHHFSPLRRECYRQAAERRRGGPSAAGALGVHGWRARPPSPEEVIPKAEKSIPPQHCRAPAARARAAGLRQFLRGAGQGGVMAPGASTQNRRAGTLRIDETRCLASRGTT